MQLSDAVREQLIIALFSAAIGALITVLISTLLSKTAKIRYSSRTERVGTAADDPVFGTVRVAWRGNEVRNLYMASVEIENASNRDFDNVDFKIYTGNETILLNEQTAVVGTPDIVHWSEAFRTAIAVPAGAAPTDRQWGIYNHSREYHVAVLNRGEVLHLNYLCTRPNDDMAPMVFVSLQLKGAKLKHEWRSNLIVGVPVQTAGLRGLILTIVVVIASGLVFQNVWVTGAVSAAVGLFAQVLGAWEYKGERWLRNLIAG